MRFSRPWITGSKLFALGSFASPTPSWGAFQWVGTIQLFAEDCQGGRPSAQMSESTPPHIPRKALSIDEAAETLGVSHWTIRRLIKSGAIRSCRVLRVHLIPIGEIDRLLAGDSPFDSKK